MKKERSHDESQNERKENVIYMKYLLHLLILRYETKIPRLVHLRKIKKNV